MSDAPVERECFGYFEEFLLDRGDAVWPKGLGALIYPVQLPPEQQGRKLGYAGKRVFVVTEPITLHKGHKVVTYKASPKKPLKVSTQLQRLEGRELR